MASMGPSLMNSMAMFSGAPEPPNNSNGAPMIMTSASPIPMASQMSQYSAVQNGSPHNNPLSSMMSSVLGSKAPAAGPMGSTVMGSAMNMGSALMGSTMMN